MNQQRSAIKGGRLSIMKQRLVKVSCHFICIFIVFSIQAEIQQPTVCKQRVMNLLQPSIEAYFNQYFGQALSGQIQLLLSAHPPIADNEGGRGPRQQ